jgi:hypothetical protein
MARPEKSPSSITLLEIREDVRRIARDEGVYAEAGQAAFFKSR